MIRTILTSQSIIGLQGNKIYVAANIPDIIPIEQYKCLNNDTKYVAGLRDDYFNRCSRDLLCRLYLKKAYSPID